MSLLKTMVDVAAEVLKNTKGIHSKMKKDMDERLRLLSKAFGEANVEEDFRKWCAESLSGGTIPRYPVTAYLKVADTRLADPSTQPTADDPRIGELGAFTYELTGILPALVHMTKLLAVYDLPEIKDALKEYADLLEDKELKAGMKSFFAEGGAVAVIHARRKREVKPSAL